MKILILLRKKEGGVGVVTENIKKELEKKGHIIKVISREDDLKIKSFRKSIPRIRRVITEIMKKENYDIIYTQDWSMALPLLLPFPIFRKKVFCCFHGNQLGKSKIIQDIVGRILGKRLIVVGDSLKKRFPRSNLIYNGIDIKKFRSLNKKRDSIGWIDKDTESIPKEDIQKLGKGLGVPIVIAKKIPHEKMNAFYNKCQIFISLPPFSAGFNLCWLEAMAAGVPVVIGNDEGIGFKLPIQKVKNFQELKKNIKKFEKKSYKKWLKENDFSWKKHARELIRVMGQTS